MAAVLADADLHLLKPTIKIFDSCAFLNQIRLQWQAFMQARSRICSLTPPSPCARWRRKTQDSMSGGLRSTFFDATSLERTRVGPKISARRKAVYLAEAEPRPMRGRFGIPGPMPTRGAVSPVVRRLAFPSPDRRPCTQRHGSKDMLLSIDSTVSDKVWFHAGPDQRKSCGGPAERRGSRS